MLTALFCRTVAAAAMKAAEFADTRAESRARARRRRHADLAFDRLDWRTLRDIGFVERGLGDL